MDLFKGYFKLSDALQVARSTSLSWTLFWFDNLGGAYEKMWLISLEEFYESCSQFADQEYSAAPNDTWARPVARQLQDIL